MLDKYTIGLDFGTNSVRALLVGMSAGEEIATHAWNYQHGDAGIVLDARDPNLARQHPADYLEGIVETVRAVLKEASRRPGFSPDQVIGIGVDTTGSTPLPVDENGEPLALQAGFSGRLSALAWLWKDHTAHSEAGEITTAAEKRRPEYLAKCGGRYSSEWYWSKVLHCARVSPDVFDAAYTWVEIADWIPAVLTGTTHPSRLKRCICAAGHKAMYNADWGGYPDEVFLSALDPRLARLRQTLPTHAHSIANSAGGLSAHWAGKLGLIEGIPVAVGAFDAHLGAVGAGVQPGVLVKVIGTSSCDITVSAMDGATPDIPGLCGIVPESVLPGTLGLEAGQAAVGDIFNWFVNVIDPGGPVKGSHEALTEGAAQLKPGESGLLSLDWHNGNRTVLVDQRLTGMVLGLTLHTTPAEIYRALIEATAFGARTIVERFREYNVAVDRVINCGGIAAKNPLVMQIYADVLGRPVLISRSAQTCALGAAMAGAVVAGTEAGGYASFPDAIERMTGVQDRQFQPIPENVAVYNRLYTLYESLHNAFGVDGHSEELFNVMKDLLELRDQVRGATEAGEGGE